MKKLCPLRGKEMMFLDCIEENCGFWNERYKACGLRLAQKKDGGVK